ncbi:MAG: DHH family phosphoesterase, partial [bacterium]
MIRPWKIRPFDPETVDRLVQELSLSPLIARLLAQRGISDSSDARAFLNPSQDLLHSPFLFSEMEQAVERISAARQQSERVVIHGDYDVDGISGTAILLETLWELGIEVDYYLPHRIEEGYGLNIKSVQELAGQFDLMITVDCGATAVEEVALARERGLDVIITD